ncbi:MAG: cbb3-type cytochrome c oxidase subunit II [Acidobacteria bacterium]|nr:cbb3-type cytochrome c oxidase subunit II [Acidobacteriota bacterium]
MRGLMPLFLGLFGTFAFSWLGLTVIPNMQIGALNPQMDEEQTDIYPVPPSGMVQEGRRVYAANGCMYCHSRQLRADYASADLDRERDAGPSPRPKWGGRRSAPRDYVFERPVLLGEERLGPDLADLGKAAPSAEESAAPAPAANAPAASPAASGPNNAPPKAGAPATSPAPAQSPAAANAAPAKPGTSVSPAPAGSPASATAAANPSPTPNLNGVPPAYSEAWHHRHLYAPQSMSAESRDSIMPAYRFLYEQRRIGGERSADALQLTGADAPPAGWEVVPTYEANCLVAYLMAQDQSHGLKEVKSAPGAPPAAAGSPAAAAPAGSPAAAPPKK